MKTTEIREAFWMFLPQGLDELFEMVRFERTDSAYDILLMRRNSVRKKTGAIQI